ncbi:MAG TPA: PorP/SprF family type IX secretion system membrane protein [Bacteroidia bacterium]|jgi:type IX secretion system PorP/SprF family membrane protein
MKKAILLPALLISISALYAQDIHFSQYMQTPSLVNPALTGASAVVRASVIYKDQWRSVTVPYKTYGASFEMKFKASNWEKADKFKTKIYKKSFSRMAGGLSFYRDRAGDGNMGSTQANLSLATFVPTGRHSSLSLGLQASIVQQSVDVSKLVFPNQYGTSGYDPGMSSGENYAAQNFIYPDFAGGINWSYGFNERSIGANNEKRANIGASVYHFNQPKQLYLDDSKERLNPKYIFHADMLYGIRNTNVALIPSFIATFQGPAMEMIEGFMVKYYFKEDSKYTGIIKRSGLGLGVAYRNTDAVIFSVLLEYENYAAGVSYDINTSKLSRATTGRGGPEIFVRFVTPNPFLYQKSRARFN